MLIGIDASRAFLKKRTGIEEYAYQTIKHLRAVIPESETVVLYVRKKWKRENWKLEIYAQEIDFELPPHWQVRALWAPRFWTQIRLSWEMLFRGPDVLFVPAHTVPIIHPRNTIVTVHGLEYEFCPDAYSWWDRLYMRCSIRFSVRAARTVICVSENTKRDVMRLYRVPAEKIKIIYEGYDSNFKFHISNFQSYPNVKNQNEKPYLLFIGRLEERKNIVRIIEAFEILKEKYEVPHSLVLAGKCGYGYANIKFQISHSKYKESIFELGYISEDEKWSLLKKADAFLFPTLYEGFGIPVLEAQSVGVPVITSHTSSLPEIGGEGAVYVDPMRSESIADGAWRVLSDARFKDGIIQAGRDNVQRFSWEGCAQEIQYSFLTSNGK